jgi:hypothetical protein
LLIGLWGTQADRWNWILAEATLKYYINKQHHLQRVVYTK